MKNTKLGEIRVRGAGASLATWDPEFYLRVDELGEIRICFTTPDGEEVAPLYIGIHGGKVGFHTHHHIPASLQEYFALASSGRVLIF